MQDAVEHLESLGVDPVADPLLAVDPTGELPRDDADVVIFTSKTGAELIAGQWEPGDTTVAAIGDPTATALEAAGIPVDLVPTEFSSAGLVDALADRAAGKRIEVARSDHGSDVLPDGLWERGAFVHETVLYRLVRPEGAGDSATLAARGGLDGALFTSSLTVEHFFESAEERDRRSAALDGLSNAVVGTIGEPTRETARDYGLENVVVPDTADFETLARTVADRIERR